MNTVIRTRDAATGRVMLTGHNTDAEGFIQAIASGLESHGLKDKVTKAVVYGYGGVSTVVFRFGE